MNISTLIGVLVGFIVLGVAIYAISEEHVNIYWGEESLQGLLLVLGCVTAATFISYPFREVRNVMKVLRLALTRDELPVEVYTQEIETLSGEALQRGTSRLKGAADEVGSQFLEDGLRMVVDKYTAEDIREIMTEQIKHTY